MRRHFYFFLIVAFALMASGCKISGTIEEEGFGLEGVTLSLNGPASMITTTDSDGRYRFINFKKGNYTLTPSLDGYTFYPERIDVTFDGTILSQIDFYTEDTGAASRGKRYNEVVYVTTHNAMSNSQDHWLFPNQQFNIQQQLKDGVRAFMLDLWPKDGDDDVYLCHGGIFIGGFDLLKNQLNVIKTFMDIYDREVVTLIFETYVDAGAVKEVFDECGLISYLHTQPIDQPWPTLQEMIDQNKRLVIFTDDDETLPDMPWYHYCWDYCWETHYSARGPEDFSCDPNRGNIGNELFIFNHFLTNKIGGAKNLAKQVNFNPFFIDRVLTCQSNANQLPNFVTVDFYKVGDVFDVKEVLNQ